MARNHVIEKGEGCVIAWLPNCDPTQIKKKKKKKVAGKSKNVTVTVKTESFFNFFDTVEAKEIEAVGEDDEDEEAMDLGEKMDEHYDIGNAFKDDLVPLALEYYLGVIEEEGPDGMDDDDDDSDDGGKKGKKLTKA